MSNTDDEEFYRDFSAPERAATVGKAKVAGGLWITSPAVNSVELELREALYFEPACAIEVEFREDGLDDDHASAAEPHAPAALAVEPPTDLEKIRAALVNWHLEKIALARSMGPSVTEKQFKDACELEGL